MNAILVLSSIVVLNPFLVFGQNSSQKCPDFDSVIPLRPLATSSNWSYAFVADGKYHLVGGKFAEASGDMPPGFEDSRLNVVIDGFNCEESNYYLLTIKSFRLSDNSLETNYSTLDLIKWSQRSRWSDPKPISAHPMLSKDPFVKILTQFVPIEDFIHTIFYWHQMKTLFVVTKQIKRVANDSSLYYYSVGTEDICRSSYSYPEETEALRRALNSVIENLKICFFSHEREGSYGLLYCIGNNSFQVNQIIRITENGTLRTETIVSSQQRPTTDTLKVLEDICPQSNGNKTVEVIRVIRVDEEIRLNYRSNTDLTTKESSDEEEEGMSTVMVVFIILVIVALIVIASVAIANRHLLVRK